MTNSSKIRKTEKIRGQILELQKKPDTMGKSGNFYPHQPIWLPLPRITIMVNSVQFTRIIQAFQDLRYIGEMRQRWEEIKKLQMGSVAAVT